MWRRADPTVLIVSAGLTEPPLNSAFLRQPEIRLLTTQPDTAGLKLARRVRPSLIIEDLQQAGDGSLDFCDDLRADSTTRSIPLILVVSPVMSERARRVGAEALLEKPVVRRDLFRAVRRFVPLPRRRTRRLEINLRFIFEIDGRIGQAFTRDISINGAFLKTDRVAPLGSSFGCRFHIPGYSEELRCTGIVRNPSCGDPPAGQLRGLGIEFVDLDDADQELLESFIEQHRSRTLLYRPF